MRSLYGLVMLLMLGSTFAHADEVEVIPLRHRTVDQVIPTLQPLLDPGGALSGTQSALIVRSNRRNIEQLKQVIEEVDTAPRRLLISVRQDASFASERRGYGVSGTVASDNARVGINERPRRETGASVRMLDSASASDERNVSRVQALEGSPAYIAAGQSIPVPTETVTRTPYGSEVRRSTEFRDLNTGFYVVPRLMGDRVMLEIDPRRETQGAYGPGSANVQRITTTASGRLGEWFELGGITNTGAQEGNRILSSRSSGQRGTSSVWVKVEEIQ